MHPRPLAPQIPALLQNPVASGEREGASPCSSQDSQAGRGCWSEGILISGAGALPFLPSQPEDGCTKDLSSKEGRPALVPLPCSDWQCQGLILQWSKHMGAWAHLWSLLTDHFPTSKSTQLGLCSRGRASLASQAAPQSTPECTTPPFPELPRNNWEPFSLWAHHLQPFPSSNTTHGVQIQCSCMTQEFGAQPSTAKLPLAPRGAEGKEGAGCTQHPKAMGLGSTGRVWGGSGEKVEIGAPLE